MLRPLLVCFHLKTPFCGAQTPMLDAIVVGELATVMGDDAAFAQMPIRRVENTPQASVLFAADGPIGSTVAVAKLHQEWLTTDPRSVAGNRTMQKSKQLTVGDRQFKAENVMNTYPVIRAPWLIAAAVGEPEQLRQILDRITGIGKRRAVGWGEIDEIEVQQVEADLDRWGLIDRDGRPVRPVPLDLYRRIAAREPDRIEAVRSRPFYWAASTPREVCAVPASLWAHDVSLFETGVPATRTRTHVAAGTADPIRLLLDCAGELLQARSNNPRLDADRLLNRSYPMPTATPKPQRMTEVNALIIRQGRKPVLCARFALPANVLAGIELRESGHVSVMGTLHEVLISPAETDMLVILPDKRRFDAGELRISKAGEDTVWLCRPTGAEAVSRRSYATLVGLAMRGRLRDAKRVRRLLETRGSRLEDARKIDAEIDRKLAAAELVLDDVIDLPAAADMVWRLAENQAKEDRA